jgi:lipid II:glycine glycyltransferase (peptidoglycan interpeptide bridge formation enzyme)
MQIKEGSESDRSRFNAFVAEFESGDLLQSYEWGDLKSKSGWKPIRVFAESEGRIIAAASILKRNIPRTGRSILYASRGPVFDTTNSDLVREFTSGLESIARKHRAILLKIDPPVPVEDAVSVANLQAVGFKPIAASGFGGTQPKCVMQLDLDKSEDDLLRSFKEKWRYNIRLAERKGVKIREKCSREDLPIFYELLRETCERDGFLVRGLGYFEDMWDALAPAGYMNLAIAFLNDKPLSAVLIYRFGNRCWYTYGASSNQDRNVMPNHLIQWRMIRVALADGCKWYDFRGVSPKTGEGDAHLEGLNRFKDGFNPRFVEYIGEFDLVLSPFWYWAWSIARPRLQKAMKARRRAETSQSAL